MSTAAYHRARDQKSDSSRFATTARILSVVQPLLVLALAVVAALLVSLLIGRGEARVAPADVPRLPGWVSGRSTGQDGGLVLMDDTGLLPLATDNMNSGNPLHRLGSRIVFALTGRIRPLRNDAGALSTLLAVGLSLGLLISALASWRRTAAAEASSRVAANLRRQIHRQMYRLGQSSLPAEGIGTVVNLFTREVNDVRDGVFAELNHGIRSPLVATGLLVLALVISPVTTVFLASLWALIWLAYGALARSARLASQAAFRDSAVQMTLLHDDLGRLRTVRVYGIEGIDKERFDEHLEHQRRADVVRLRGEGAVTPSSGLLAGIGIALAVGLLGSNVINNRETPAAELTLAGALLGLGVPTWNWIQARKAIRRAERSAGAIQEFMTRKPELQQAVGAHFLPPLKGKITFENVTLKGASGRTLLEGFSADIPAGARTVIMGLDEDAKQALLCLIPRLIDPVVGRVRLDGLDLRDLTLESVRAQVATVLQADLSFSDTVAANIGLGDSSYGMPKIIDAAKMAHAHQFIQDLPQGYDTVIGPLGHPLSTDERYRIALARAYLHDPSIVLIEEPAETLEDDVKAMIDDTMNRIAPGRTLVILPHRLSTIRSADNVIIMHNGRVEASGNPRDMHEASQLYRHLQYVEFNQFATGEVEAGQMNG
ncbi:ABC transporter ATP-binding protein [Isosphaeraceae bacterium EP7]